MEWHIVTGEYPPQLGGVSDYTYQISQELRKGGDSVHIWSPAPPSGIVQRATEQIHDLPRGFGWRWLRELNRRLRSFTGRRNIIIQYVPHMYGWKSMNLAFCLWICRQRKHNVIVMFHEVAFPMQPGQRFRHRLLAIIHRIMASAILHSVQQSFTSTEPYYALLRRLGNNATPIDMLRICSNIPLESYQSDDAPPRPRGDAGGLFTVGIFSNFGRELREVLEPAIGCLLENPEIAVALLGPGEEFRTALAKKYPGAANRIRTTGHFHVTKLRRACEAARSAAPGGASAARGTLIGALASGVPVITTASPTTDRLLLDSNTLLFSDESPQSIRAAVEQLKENPAMGQELGAHAQQLYLESFQPAAIVLKLREVATALDSQGISELPGGNAAASPISSVRLDSRAQELLGLRSSNSR